MVLPALREDLKIYSAGASDKGLPQWTLHDPLRNLFFRLTWQAVEILSRWSLGDADRIIKSISTETTFSTSKGEIEDLAQFLIKNQLVHAMSEGDTKHLISMSRKPQQSFLKQLAHKYLFFRLPLFKPDQFLSATLTYTKPFFTKTFVILTLCALIIGVFFTLRQTSDFAQGLLSLWSLDGFVQLVVSYGCIKVIHELAHAYTAKRLGVRVPIIGVAFLVLIPMPYTDTSESWKLSKDRHRLNIAAAGIASELILAAWATFFWAFLPDGTLRDVALLMATTTWISSLIINLSPFMRFDGYFILMDFLKIPNLHQRAGGLALWQMREWLFGLDEPIPELMPNLRHRLLVAFAFATWLYRLVIFLGIAMLVYHFFIKVLGVVLFIIEIWWFVLKPVVKEIGVWMTLRNKMNVNRQLMRSAILVGAIFLTAFVPWRSHVTLPAIAVPGEYSVIYSPMSGELTSFNSERGAIFHKGDVIARLGSRELDYQYVAVQKRITLISEILQKSSLSYETVDNRLSSLEELRRLLMEKNAIEQELAKQVIVAPFSGIVDERIADVQIGAAIAEGEPLLGLRSVSQAQVVAYATEEQLGRISLDGKAHFVPKFDPMSTLSLAKASFQPLPVDTLDSPQLASIFGGPIRAQSVNNQAVPNQALYKIIYELQIGENDLNQIEVEGEVVSTGNAESFAAYYMRKILSVLIREFSF